MACEDIPSLLDLQKVKKHADDFGRLMGTGTGTSTNGVTGQVRPTYNAVMANLGYTRVGTFASGGTLLNGRQTLLWDVADGGDGQEYGWSGVFPLAGKVVPPGSTPLTTGGIAVGAWMSRFDPELRTQVREALRRSYAEAGYNLVDGSFEAGGIISDINDVMILEGTGKAYSRSLELPYTVTAGENPEADDGWVLKATSTLRDNLANYNGAALIGTPSGNVAEDLTGLGEFKGSFDKTVPILSNIKPSYPAGQIANNAEIAIPYNNAIYCLFKGSYSLNDRSYIAVIRHVNGQLRQTSIINMDVGDDARAMCIYKDTLIVFTTGKIKTFRIVVSSLQLKGEQIRSGGFVQSCLVINDRLYASCWGSGTIEVYDLTGGVPGNRRSFSIGKVGNSSIVSDGNSHYLIVWADTSNIIKLDIDANSGTIYNIGAFTIPGVFRPRLAHISGGVMYVGGFTSGTSKLVSIDISGQTPVKISQFMNMTSCIKVGNYLVGPAWDSTPAYAAYQGKLCKVDISTGEVSVISNDGYIYPTLVGNSSFVAFKSGDEGLQPGSTANDAPLGQSVSAFTFSDRDEFSIEAPALPANVSKSFSVYKIGDISVNQIYARCLQFVPLGSGEFFTVKLTFDAFAPQNSIGTATSRSAEKNYLVFASSTGTFSVLGPNNSYSSGTLSADFSLGVLDGSLVVYAVNAVPNAALSLRVSYEALKSGVVMHGEI